MGIESIELILRKKKKLTSYYRFSTSNGKVRNLRKISISHIYRAKYENNIFCLVFSLFLAQLDYCRDLSLQIYHLCCQHETLLYFVIRFQKQFFNETTIKTIYITFLPFLLNFGPYFEPFLTYMDYCRDLSFPIYHLGCQLETLLYFVFRFSKQFFQ